MSFEPSGNLVTDKQTIDDSFEWDTQTEWEAFQEANNVEIENGVVKLTSAIPDSGVSRYKFDEGSGTTAIDSIGNNDGTLNANVAYTTDAAQGSHALLFDGANNGNVDINDGGAFDFGTGDFAWIFHIKKASAVADRGSVVWDEIVLQRRQGNGNINGGITFFFNEVDGGRISADMRDASDGATAEVTSTTVINDGSYHEITIYRVDGIYTIRVDGVDEDSVDATGINVNTDDRTFIGSPNNRSFDGILDDVRVNQ